MRKPRTVSILVVLWAVWLATVVSGCASFDGTLDKTQTLRTRGGPVKITSLAVAPVPRLRSSKGLSKRLGMKLHHAVRRALPEAKVMGPALFARALAEKRGALKRFTGWHTVYTRTARLRPISVRQYRVLTGVDYLILVHPPRLERQRLSGDEAVPRCPFRLCLGPRPHHIWRTDLAVRVELIDLRKGTALWRGVGAAQGDLAGDMELHLMKESGKPQPPAELADLEEELLEIATQGVAREIAKHVSGE
jgi:hypothetical protein